MISKISAENNNNMNIYSPHPLKGRDMTAPNFKGGGLFPILMEGIQACERNPMINVAVVDLNSAILPRTFVETKTNGYAGLEAFRRESSGLIVNCMIPSVITLGIAKILNKFVMPHGINMSGCWADSNMINQISNVYNSSVSNDKVKDTFKTLLKNMEGYDGKVKVSFDKALDNELDSISEELKDLSSKQLKKKEFKKELQAITDKIIAKTKIDENIKIKGSTKDVNVSSLESTLSDTVKFFKEFNNRDKNLSMSDFAKKSKKLVKSKSLLGLAVVLPLAASMQFINRWITGKRSGVKGAPIYNDFGKENSEYNIDKKEGLLKQKIISISSMFAVGLLSLMKVPTMNMLEFKGIFPTMDQARIISTATFMSRMAAADDKNELAEATLRDIATFLSLYFLGDYAAKAAATIMEKKNHAGLLNDTKPLDKEAGVFKRIWHWIKDVKVKSSKEIESKTRYELQQKGITDAKEVEKAITKAVGHRSICQMVNLGVSLALLGIIIPVFARKNTEKRHAEDIKQAQNLTVSDNETELSAQKK